jgi:ABC-type multidrug transport system ATPase subunit
MHIALQEVSRRFGRTHALRNVTWETGPGSLVAVLGPNGAGKSTLLRILAGELPPSRGELRIDGVPFRRDDLAVRREIFFLPDTPDLPGETPLRTCSICVSAYERTGVAGIEERIVDLIEGFDLAAKADRPWPTLSRGQSYKASLAILAAIAPRLWILDEPFASGMDAKGIALFRKLAREAVAGGATVIYSTQLVELAEGFADGICVLGEGELRAALPAQELRNQARSDPWLAKLIGDLRDAPPVHEPVDGSS